MAQNKEGMRQIWKFPFKLQMNFGLTMPQGAETIHVDIDHKTGHPCIWAIVDPKRLQEKRLFFIVGTGFEFLYGSFRKHIGTIQDGDYVWHIFEICGA